MSSVPMPRDLSEEAVAEWLWDVSSIKGDPAWDDANSPSKEQAYAASRAVLALVRAKVREAVDAAYTDGFVWAEYESAAHTSERQANEKDAIVSRVLGRDGGAR